MSISIRILGCGSSGGVPRVGQGWGACDPSNPKNRRRRCSILVQKNGLNILVDTSPDLREQLLDANISTLDAVIYTHSHADHVHGIDDLRPVAIQKREVIDTYLDETTSNTLNNNFGYCFRTPAQSEYPPLLREHRIMSGKSFDISGKNGSLTCMPFDLHHGSINALGLRFDNIAYTPDVNKIPESSIQHLENIDVWIIDALRYTPHPSHFNLEQALKWIERMKPKRSVLTNLHTDMDYNALCKILPDNVSVAYDCMIIQK
jgi:phosphoribosyl 1,2-cyclic phosphate phosphodiesterase